MLRILLCDDARAFGILLTHWLQECDDIEVVAATHDPAAVAPLASEHRPDVVVLDHMLRSATSDDLVPALRDAAPGARILLISGMPPEQLASAAGRSEPDGFVSKASSAGLICDAIRAVAAVSRRPG